MSEAVTGPVERGYFVAAYACELVEQPRRYVGYYKACLEQPASYWDADCVLKGCTRYDAESPELAINGAIRKALKDLRTMPDARDFLDFKVRLLSASGRLL